MHGNRFIRWGAIGAMTAAMTVHLPASAAGDGARAVAPAEVVTVDGKTLRRMVDEELLRQLPGAVERAWQEQLLALAKERAKEQSQRKSATGQFMGTRRIKIVSVDGKAGGQ